MRGINKKLLEKEMTRQEFLRFTGGSLLVLFGLGNVISLMNHLNKSAATPRKIEVKDDRHGFGASKFGA